MSNQLDIPRDLLERLYYDEGLSQRRIAERLGCSDSTISHRMREYGLEVLVRRSKRVDVPRAVLEKLYCDEGLSVDEVARRLGRGEATIRRRLRDYGIRTRNPGEYRRLDIPRELLERLWYDEGLTQDEIAERIGCDAATIWRRLRDYGLSRPRVLYNTPREILEKLYHEGKLTQAEIAEQLGCSVATVCKQMTKLGLETRPFGPVAAGTVPDGVTWEWSPEFAYAVGLIASDGNLPKQNTNNVQFTSTDYELHLSYQRCLGVSVPIKEHLRGKNRKTIYTTTITSPRLRGLLEEIGLTPAKSKTMGRLAVPDEFFRDFFRGCIDGDGSVMILKSEQLRYLGAALFSASEVFIRWVQSVIAQQTGLQGWLYQNQKGVWRLIYAYRKGKPLLDWMYYAPDLPCLYRKRVRYDEYLRLKQDERAGPRIALRHVCCEQQLL